MRNEKVKQPSPLTSGEIDKMMYTHRGLLLVSLKEEENVNTWMSPGETKLNEISKSQKDKYYILYDSAYIIFS